MNIRDIVVEIDAEISRLRQAKALLSGIRTTESHKSSRPAKASRPTNARAKRTLSAQARARISAAQKARWAKSKRAAKKAVPSAAGVSTAKKAANVGSRANSTKKRTLSAGARAKIAAAQKARWAEVRNATKKASPTKDAKKSETAKKSVAAA
jgi:hypothetical protein